MGYQQQDGRWADTREVTLAAGVIATTGQGPSVELGDRGVARLTLAVSAFTGTSPTLDVTIETSRDGATWYSAGTFAQAIGIGTERKIFTIDRYVRAAYVVGGTASPSFTLTLSGEAV